MKFSTTALAAIATGLLTISPAYATSTDKTEQRVLAWTKSVEREVLSNVKYTGGDHIGARREPVVTFTVGADGVIRDIRLAQSSGHAAADRAAVRAVDLTNEVSRPPQGVAQNVTFKPVLITPGLRER